MSKSKYRSSSGNMLSMVVLVGMVLLLVCGCGFVVSILFTSHHRNQMKADDLALSLALGLNKHNWVGQMNNLVESARELVFTSRDAHEEVLADYPRLRSLSERLMNEARESAAFVERERISLGRELCKSAQHSAAVTNEQRQAQPLFSLPWLETETISVKALEVGRIRNVQSSAHLPQALPSLKDYDMRKGIANKQSELYNSCDKAALPSPDDDLLFAFCSLPAAVEKSIPSARITGNDAFEPTALIFDDGMNYSANLKSLPSAVRLTAVMNVRGTLNRTVKPGEVKIVVSAASPGSEPDFP
ncbi:MAG: hypothetical protein JST89_11780 [Cyanobacteria bacterium SZAS-4]|nr:hypothetical protein [Cyanobacteria bacterium SZAS-4]